MQATVLVRRDTAPARVLPGPLLVLEHYSTKGAGAANSVGADWSSCGVHCRRWRCAAHRWCGRDTLPNWCWCGKLNARWSGAAHRWRGAYVLYHWSWCGITYGWDWREALVNRHRCSLQCRCWRSMAPSRSRSDVFHRRAGRKILCGSWENTARSRSWGKILHHKSWCGRHWRGVIERGCCCTSGVPTQFMPSPVAVIVGCLSRVNFLCSSPRGSTALHGASIHGVPRPHCGCGTKLCADPVEVDSSHSHRGCVGGETVLRLCLEHLRRCCVAQGWCRTTVLHHRSWCGMTCGWTRRNVLDDRRRCIIHCRYWRHMARKQRKADVLHGKVCAVYTARAGVA